MDPSILSEWHSTLHSLPHHKASGTSSISNEMLQHIGPRSLHYLWLLTCFCLKLNDIPQQWREAYIYPIPKPKEWKYNLANTRTITLLETARKALVKILTQRLMTIFVDNHILKGLNFAGLPHQSTFEPLRLLDNILNDAKENNKELYIFSQDMSKAYDRVNIHMLQKAMNRLKLPLPFIQFISNLFTNRYNRIFMAHGTTDAYKVLVGIDQGEVISPLLWCIYYDPLLSKLQSCAEQNLTGYELFHTWRPDVTKSNTNTESCNIPLSAFMDDSHWITDSTPKLVFTLNITTSFNKLNDVQTNNDKAVLLATKSPENGEPIKLELDTTTIEIQPLKPKESTRILGVWLTTGKSNQHVYRQLKDEVKQCCDLLSSKIVTDKQLLYIYNAVIIPRLEFRCQLVFLTESQCDALQVPFRTLFKHKLHMPKTTPNAILMNNLIYKFQDLYQRQIQEKFTSLTCLLHDSSIVEVSTHIRILKLQAKWHLPQSPLADWPIRHKPNGKDYIADLLSGMKDFDLSFEVDPLFLNKIEGGTISITSVLDVKSITNALTSLRHNNMMFLDQVTSLDGIMLSRWIDTRLYVQNTVGKATKWFSILESIVLQSPQSSLRLKLEFQTPCKPPGDYTPLTLIKKARPKEWITVWHNPSRNSLYGQVCKTINDNQEILFAHWKNDFSTIHSSPSHQPLQLVQCQGCNLNDISIDTINKYSKTPRPPCVISCFHNDALHVPTTTKKKTDSNITFSISTLVLKQIAKHHYMTNNPIPNSNIITYPENIAFQHTPIPPFKSPFTFIEKYITSPTYCRELTRISHIFSSRNTFTFYTDGSVQRINNVTMAAAAWIEITTVVPTEFSNAVNINFISSTKTELVAVIAAIITLPPNSTTNIYTDSKNVITTYNTIQQQHVLKYPRLCLKTPHIDLWYILFDIIYNKDLTIIFHKVKAHNGNDHNEYVDTLAKEAIYSDVMDFNTINSLYIVIPKYNNFLITTHLRSFIKNLSNVKGFFKFYQLHRNAKYRQLDIDWNNTFAYLNADSTTITTSFNSSNLKARRVKLIMEELPTLEYLTHCKPKLYEKWTCMYCDHQETFNHIWICRHNKPILEEIVLLVQDILFKLISLTQPNLEYDHPAVMRIVNDPHIWNVEVSYDIFTFIDLIKGFVPSSLSSDIHNIVSTKTLTTSITTSFLQALHDQIYKDIWMPRCALVISREKHLNITQSQKIHTENKSATFLKRSVHVPDRLSSAEPANFVLQSTSTLLAASITSGLHHSLFTGVLIPHFSPLA